MIIANKEIGETPLECLERMRLENAIVDDVPMTYAGRFDPLASGKLLILVGKECKEKEKYLGLDKEYEVEIIFGIETDTGDALGLIRKVAADAMSCLADVYNVYTLSSSSKKDLSQAVTGHDFLSSSPWIKLCGKFTQEYPVYSSKTVLPRSDLGKKRQLHSLARSGELPDEMPTKEVEIYSIEEMDKGSDHRGLGEDGEMSGRELAAQAIENVSKVKGDFRQKEIITDWKKFKEKYGDSNFPLIKLRVACSSGTYMRSLAERIGREAGTVAFAFSIKRTRVGWF